MLNNKLMETWKPKVGPMEAESFFGGEQRQVIENKIHLKLSLVEINRKPKN